VTEWERENNKKNKVHKDVLQKGSLKYNQDLWSKHMWGSRYIYKL